MTCEGLKIIEMMVDEGLTVEEIVNHFGFFESEKSLIVQYLGKKEEKKNGRY